MINLALQPAQRIATNSAEEQQAWEESPQIPTVPNQSDTINLFRTRTSNNTPSATGTTKRLTRQTNQQRLKIYAHK